MGTFHIILMQSMREHVFKEYKIYKKYWKREMKTLNMLPDDKKLKMETESAFIAKHIHRFFSVLDGIKSEGEFNFTNLYPNN